MDSFEHRPLSISQQFHNGLSEPGSSGFKDPGSEIRPENEETNDSDRSREKKKQKSAQESKKKRHKKTKCFSSDEYFTTGSAASTSCMHSRPLCVSHLYKIKTKNLLSHLTYCTKSCSCDSVCCQSCFHHVGQTRSKPKDLLTWAETETWRVFVFVSLIQFYHIDIQEIHSLLQAAASHTVRLFKTQRGPWGPGRAMRCEIESLIKLGFLFQRDMDHQTGQFWL